MTHTKNRAPKAPFLTRIFHTPLKSRTGYRVGRLPAGASAQAGALRCAPLPGWRMLALALLACLAPLRSYGQAQVARSALAFQTANGGEFTFDTGLLRGKLRPQGKALGLCSVVYLPTGQQLDKGGGGPGLFSHYRVFTSNHRYGVGAWDWPSTASLQADGSVQVRWPAQEGRPFAMEAHYRWIRPDELELETVVQAHQNLSGFESFLASYFQDDFTNALVCGTSAQGQTKTPVLLALEQRFGDWQMFPRDAAALELIQDGRWQLPPNPVAWNTNRPLGAPIAARSAPASGVTVVLSSSARDCFAIAGPHQTDAHHSLYLSLFGRDIPAGTTARARARLYVGARLSNAQILAAAAQ